MNPFRFGTSVRDITPRYPAWTHGYAARTRPSSGVLEPISLGCLAVGNGENTVLIVTLDMIGVRADVCEELYALLEKETGVGFPNVMIASSHTGLTQQRYLKYHRIPRTRVRPNAGQSTIGVGLNPRAIQVSVDGGCRASKEGKVQLLSVERVSRSEIMLSGMAAGMPLGVPAFSLAVLCQNRHPLCRNWQQDGNVG